MRTRQCHSGSKREFQRGSNVVCERWAEEGQIMEGECSKCRAAIDEGRFCSNCGHPIEDAQAGSGDGEGEKNAAKRNETASSQERTLECLEALGRGGGGKESPSEQKRDVRRRSRCFLSRRDGARLFDVLGDKFEIRCP